MDPNGGGHSAVGAALCGFVGDHGESKKDRQRISGELGGKSRDCVVMATKDGQWGFYVKTGAKS